MHTWSADEIRALAMQCVGNRSALRFIRSEEAANAVAARARQHLTTAGVNPTRACEIVKVGPCPRHTGTWMVSVELPGMIIRTAIGRERAREQMQALNAERRFQLLLGWNALRGAYSATDLVTTWTGKHPPMAS